MKFDSDGFLQSLSGSQQTAPDQNFQLGRSETNYQIQRHSIDKLAGKPHAELEGLIEDVPWIVVNSKAMIRATLQERTKGWDLKRIVFETNHLVHSQKTSAKDLLEVSTKIQELLWLNPQLSEDLLHLAIELGPKHILFDEILKALTWVGDKNSQVALQKLLAQYKSDESATVRVMVGMAFVDNPTVESQQALESVAQNPLSPMIGRTAELMLGQMAFQLRDKEINRAEEIQSRYIEQLRSPENTAQVRHALNVIGNSGICKDFETISQFVSHPDSEISSRALEALRFCQDSRVSSLVLNTFSKTEEEKKLAIKILEMRAQRHIFDSDVFSTLLGWVRVNGPTSSLTKSVVGILGQLARLDSGAAAQFGELRADCDRIGICADF